MVEPLALWKLERHVTVRVVPSTELQEYSPQSYTTSYPHKLPGFPIFDVIKFCREQLTVQPCMCNLRCFLACTGWTGTLSEWWMKRIYCLHKGLSELSGVLAEDRELLRNFLLPVPVWLCVLRETERWREMEKDGEI